MRRLLLWEDRPIWAVLLVKTESPSTTQGVNKAKSDTRAVQVRAELKKHTRATVEAARTEVFDLVNQPCGRQSLRLAAAD
jgi:hypothetical protein